MVLMLAAIAIISYVYYYEFVRHNWIIRKNT
jgi:hypothetical protein